MSLSVPCPLFLEELWHQLEDHLDYWQLQQAITADSDKHPEFTIVHNLMLKKGWIWLPRGLPLIPTLLVEYYSTPIGGHMGIAKTIARLSKKFCWLGLREDVCQFVSHCIDCQHAKYATKRVVRLLCPLPVPHQPWEDLSLDFTIGLPPYHDNTMILVVVDRF